MDLKILSTNLQRVRQSKGKTQGEVADAAGLSRVGYRSIEAGEAMPRVDSLLRVASALEVRLEDLLAPVRELKRVRFRADKKMTTRGELLTDVARWIDDYNDLEALLLDAGAIEKNPFRLAVLRKQLADRPSGEDRARKAAAAARKKLGLDGALIRDICGLLEEHGAKVYTPQLASELFFGLSVADGDGGPAIVVNTWERLSVERWIFTAAHELGHLLLHLDDKTYDASRSEENPGQEKEADVFASHFLMPEDIFRREVEEARGLPLLDAVFKLKRMFHVSWKTVLYRLSDETPRGRAVWGMFQKQCAQRFGQTIGAREEPEGLDLHDFRNMRPPARAADEPSHLDLSDFLGGRLLRLVRIAVEKQIVSMSRAAEILRKDQESMRNLVNEWMK